MNRIAAAVAKIQQLYNENQNLQNYIVHLNTEYEIITDQYMNGNITYPIGPQQRKLKSAANKAARQMEKNSELIRKLKVRYSL